jgi:hypothetical protein
LFFRFLNEFCTLDPLESSETCDFIDLLKNEEKFTGYAGPTANRIWSKIYSELCFLPEEVPFPDELNVLYITFYSFIAFVRSSLL